MTKNITLEDACELLDLAPQTIKGHCRTNDMPWIKKGAKGKAWEFDKEAILAWYGDFKAGRTNANGESYEDARARKMKAEATLAEIQVEREKKTLVPIDEIANIVTDEYSNVRAKLLSIPAKVSPTLYMIDDLMETQTILELAINEVLEELQADNEYLNII